MLRKRILALLLCLVMCLPAFVACANKTAVDENNKGAYITMYLTEEIYNFDPAFAHTNEQAESIISLLFMRLFSLDAKGKLTYELAKEYEMVEDKKTGEVYMLLTLNDSWWSDKTKVTADDIVYAWKRILNSENSFACASLLFDIKNARAVKAGNCSIDDLGIYALNDNTLQINFEKPIDEQAFLLNLTSLALVPLREDYVSKGDDWAKKPGTMVTSGPFKLSKVMFEETGETYPDTHATDSAGKPIDYTKKEKGSAYSMLVLERNICYLRDPSDKDLALNDQVEPYRIIVDCTKSAQDLYTSVLQGGVTSTFDKDGDASTKDDVLTVCGDIFFMGQVPAAMRPYQEILDLVDVTHALSTQVLYLNENALIKNAATGEMVALFANADVRRALSLALDRQAVAQSLVFAEAATGLVPNGIFESGTSGSFRTSGGSLISTGADLSTAASLLSKAGITPKDYTFSIVANANDEDLLLMAKTAAKAWSALGFNVSVKQRGTILNNDYYAPVASVPTDICDDLFAENLMYNDYEVIALDYCAYSATAYAMLAPLAPAFSGMVDSDFNMIPHSTGYNSEAYNALIEAVYYLPYYSQISSADYGSFVIYDSAEDFEAVLNSAKAIYDTYGIDPTNAKKMAESKALLLHEAEKLLMADMPVIPVVFNMNATITTPSLKKTSGGLYTAYNFESTVLEDWENYVVDFENIYARKAPKKK